MTAKHPAVDYAAMTDDELNRAVAERLGYEVVQTEDAPCFSQNREWLWVFMRKAPGDCEPLTAWATSIDAAAALDFGDAIWTIVVRPGDPVEVEVMTTRGILLFIEAANMARAIAEAWLHYMDATGDEP